LIAATAENFVDATGRLNQVVTRQIDSILPTFDRVLTSSSSRGRRLVLGPQATRDRRRQSDERPSFGLEVGAG
jgi:hypothetical protein